MTKRSRPMSDTNSDVKIKAVIATPTPNSTGKSNRDRMTVLTKRRTSSAPVPAVEIEMRAVHRFIRDDDANVCSVAAMRDMTISNGLPYRPPEPACRGRKSWRNATFKTPLRGARQQSFEAVIILVIRSRRGRPASDLSWIGLSSSLSWRRTTLKFATRPPFRKMIRLCSKINGLIYFADSDVFSSTSAIS